MMSDKQKVFIFGEVLFDCFPTGEQVLGGAPFNVAWHLQALGNQPQFISRVGADELGNKILTAMDNWGMNTASVQRDQVNPTGRVEVEVINNDPHYTITPDCAYDFINASDISSLPANSILYHGSLGLRNAVSRETFRQLANSSDLSIFLDVNLRSPWWQKEEVYDWMKQARWVKLNEDEMRLLDFSSTNIQLEMAKLQAQFNLEQLIVTRGEEGALVRTRDGILHQVKPEPAKQIVDTVGAGDAFTAIYIHGLISSWKVSDSLNIAQQFASQVIGLRGATSTDPAFYQGFKD